MIFFVQILMHISSVKREDMGLFVSNFNLSRLYNLAYLNNKK
jgi:hypothetical protein